MSSAGKASNGTVGASVSSGPLVEWPGLAALSLLVALLFRDALFSGGVFFRRDVHLVWHPQVEGFVRAVAEGAWPVWDPAPAFGQPLLADPSAQILYPPTWLNLIMKPWTYYTWFVLGHCLWTAWGAYRLSRHWKVSVGGALVAAGVWTTCGPLLSLLDLWHHLAGAAWIPWVLLKVDEMLLLRTARATVACGLVLALQILAGSADMCAMTLFIAAAGAAVFHVQWRGPAAANGKIIGAGCLALATALGASAGLWMSALDVVSRAARSNLPFETRAYWSVHPLGLLELIVPGLWSAIPLSPGLRELLFESREPFLGSLYLGIPTLALAAGAVFFTKAPRPRLLAACAVLGVLIALGRHLPAYDLAMTVFPPLRILRYPVKAMVPTALLICLLAGMGFDAWRSAAEGSRRASILSNGIVLAVVATLGLGLAVAPDQRLAAFLPAAGDGLVGSTQLVRFRLEVALFLGALVGLLSLLRTVAARPEWAAAVLSTVALVDLATFHRNPSPLAPRALYTYRPAVLDLLRGATRVYTYDYTQRDKGARYLAGALGPQLARTPEGWRAEEASALAHQMALTPASAGRWALRTGFDIDYRGLHAGELTRLAALLRAFEGSPLHNRLLRMASVTHVVALHSRGFEGLESSSLPGLFRQPIRVFQIPAALPRTFVVSGVRVADGFAALESLVSPDFDPVQEVILPIGSPDAPPGPPPGRSEIQAERADRVRLAATLDRPGYVVLNDGFDPGWLVTLDGRPAPALRANLAFRAVAVPAGQHVIEWVYRPWAMRLGLATSGATLLLALACLAPRGSRSRSQP